MDLKDSLILLKYFGKTCTWASPPLRLHEVR